MEATEIQKNNAIQDLSECLNNNGVYNNIKDIAIAYFNNKHIDNDSQFWYDLEETIINMIDEYEGD